MFDVLLEQLATTLDSNHVPYMVIGGQAVLVYGEARFSKDVDVTLGWDASHASKIIRLVKSMGWKVLVDNPEAFVDETMVLPCEDPSTGIRFDFIFSASEYEKEALKRAVTRQLGKAKVRYASLEDVVILKIIAGRPRDLEDVKGMLAKNLNHDKAHIRKWLGAFEKALDRSLLRTYDNLLKE